VEQGTAAAFSKENNVVTAQDAQNALKNLFADTLQELAGSEHLDYEKHDVGNKKTTNSPSGKSKKRISSE
jgi:putative transposase